MTTYPVQRLTLSTAWAARCALLASLAVAGCQSRAPAPGVASVPVEPRTQGAASSSTARAPLTLADNQIPVTITADRGPLGNGVVSLGVPFPPGMLASAEAIRVLDASGNEVPAYTASLAVWPPDGPHGGSQRSVLVAFRARLESGESVTWTIEHGVPRTAQAGTLEPAPDGPAVATLPASWYARSRVIGYQITAEQNTVFANWGRKLEDGLARMKPAWDSYGMSCQRTADERTYYDAPHALFQRFIHTGSIQSYRRAREEAVWYRGYELSWHDAGKVAQYACAGAWVPRRAMKWQYLRNMLAQGMLDDYLLTGDPQALRALRGLGEAYRQNLPALMAGEYPAITATERNLAWTLMGLASYYAVDQRAEVKEALDQLIELAVSWQEAGTSGAFEHDVHRPAPEECGNGPRGGSPFMTSLLVDGLMDAWLLTGDARIPGVVIKAAAWLRDQAVTREGTGFQYLWGCLDREYHGNELADLNLLIVHVFGAAYVLSGDTAWLDVGDQMAQHGVDAMYVGKPKNWTQSARTFMKYMGYRAQGRTP